MNDKNNKVNRIPVLGWGIRLAQRIVLPGFEGLTLYDLLSIYFAGIIRGAFSLRANAISFNFFMAIFPFLLFLLNLIPFVWFIDDFQAKFLQYVDTLLPPQTHQFFNTIFLDIASNQRVGLLSFVFFLSIFLMANGINAIFDGFKYSYHNPTKRSFLRQYFIALGVSIIIAMLVLITVIVTIYLTYILENLREFGSLFDNLFWINSGRYFIFAVMIYLGVATLYYFGTKKGKLHKFFSIGATFTLLLILMTTFLFAVYITNFSTYNKIYGSIGALLILMVYIWLNANILLLGFELNAAIKYLKQKK